MAHYYKPLPKATACANVERRSNGYIGGATQVSHINNIRGIDAFAVNSHHVLLGNPPCVLAGHSPVRTILHDYKVETEAWPLRGTVDDGRVQ